MASMAPGDRMPLVLSPAEEEFRQGLANVTVLLQNMVESHVLAHHRRQETVAINPVQVRRLCAYLLQASSQHHQGGF